MNTIFGSIGLSLAVIGMIMVTILGLCRCSWVFITYWMLFYIMVVFTFYIGALGIVISIILAGGYFFTQVIRFLFPER